MRIGKDWVVDVTWVAAAQRFLTMQHEDISAAILCYIIICVSKIFAFFFNICYNKE